MISFQALLFFFHPIKAFFMKGSLKLKKTHSYKHSIFHFKKIRRMGGAANFWAGFLFLFLNVGTSMAIIYISTVQVILSIFGITELLHTIKTLLSFLTRILKGFHKDSLHR